MTARDLAPLVDVSIVVVAVSVGLLHAFAMLILGVYALPVRVVLWFAAWRFAYKVLHAVAQGHRELPTPELGALNPLAEIRLVTHFLLFPVAIGVLVGVDAVPDLLRWPAVLLLAGLFPASAAVMAITDNFALALSPWHLGALLGRLGRAYLKLLGWCVAFVALIGVVRAVPWPALIDAVVANTADTWAVLGVFALTGALIREHRADFDIEGEVEPAEERAERERRRGWQLRLDDAYASIRSGLLTQGRGRIEELLEAEERGLVVYAWVFDATLRWETKDTALWVGRQYAERLVEAGDVHEALDIVARCRRLSERFHVGREPSLTLAAYARSIGRHALAEDLELGAAAAAAAD